MAATARLIVMMEEADKAAIEAQAEAAKVSTAEFVRRRILGRGDPEERALLEMLAELKPLVRRAVRTIDANLAEIRALRARREARDTRTSGRARSGLSPEDLAAVADRLHPAPHPPSGRRRRGARP